MRGWDSQLLSHLLFEENFACVVDMMMMMMM